jgi:hypothetical protein
MSPVNLIVFGFSSAGYNGLNNALPCMSGWKTRVEGTGKRKQVRSDREMLMKNADLCGRKLAEEKDDIAGKHTI